MEHVITEAEDNASRFLSNAANEAFEIIGGVLYYREKSIDFIENAADTAIQHLQESAVGSLLEGAADAAVENLSLGLVHNEANTEHPKSYAAGRFLGDFASEVISFSEAVAGATIEGFGVALDGSGIGIIAGVGLNIAGVAMIGHASTVMSNGASNLGKDTSDWVQSFKGGDSGGNVTVR